MQLTNVNFQYQGGRAVRGKFNKAFWERLSKTDKKNIKTILSKNQHKRINERTLIYQLTKPIKINNITILSVRLKGVCPKIEDNGTIPENKGRCYVDQPILVDKNGTTFINKSNPGAPLGGARLTECSREFEVASQFAPAYADFPIGVGSFPELMFKDSPLGFIVFGMQTSQDLRAKDIIYPSNIATSYYKPDNPGFVSNNYFSNFFFALGEAKETFDQVYVHRYFHFGNYGLLSANRPKVCDFEAVRKVSELTPLARLAYFTIDLSRLFSDLSAKREFWHERKLITRFSLAHLIAPFLNGYFGQETEFNPTSDYFKRPRSTETQAIKFMAEIRNRTQKGEVFNIPEVLTSSSNRFIQLINQKLAEQAGL